MLRFSAKTAVLGLFLLISLTYANALKNPFMLDDYGFFGANVKEPLWSFFVPNRNQALGLESPQMERTYYRPLAHVFPLACYRFFGGQPFGYHVVNMLLLWAAAVCIYFFFRNLRKWTGRLSWGESDWDSFALMAATNFFCKKKS